MENVFNEFDLWPFYFEITSFVIPHYQVASEPTAKNPTKKKTMAFIHEIIHLLD